jgi:hypothetical protein
MLKWLNLINKIKMVEPLSESDFKYSREPSFQVLRQFLKASFIREELPNLHNIPIKSFLVGGLLPLKELRSSNVPHSCFHTQRDQEWLQSILLVFNLLLWF